MITRREACFVILTVVLSSVSALDCPTNQECICQPSYLKGIEINCPTKNDSAFNIIIRPGDTFSGQYIQMFLLIEIVCSNSPDWSDFHLNVTALTKNEIIKRLEFSMCDLPTNNSLGKIARILGVTDVETLSFQSKKNMNSTMVKHHLDDFENLKYLNLRISNSYVNKDLLAGLVNLTGLSLRETNNLRLVAEFFNYTPGLEWLVLDDSSLQSIELGTFDNLKNLKILSLDNNHLTEVQSGIFDELAALDELSLIGNDMIELPEDIFAKLKNLKFIDLSLNNFTHLPRNLLRNNTKLNEVILYGNKRNMTTLPYEFFANLTLLESLALYWNGLVTLPEDLFWGCTSLTSITLTENYLQALPLHIFRDLKQLKELQLYSNDLETLPDFIFWSNNKLIKLDLSKNRITFISDHLFNGLYTLEELNMEGNRLMTISNYGFSSLNKLKIAKLSNNYLTLYKPERSPFNDCESLKKLYLANNNISEIFLDWRYYLPQLEELDLKYNNIPYISGYDVFFWTINNLKVDLTHNKIEHIILNDTERFEGFASWLLNQQNPIRDAIILVDDNPLHCDCTLYDFLRYIEGKMHPKVQNYFHIKPENLTCQRPKELENVRVTDLKSETFKCVIVDPSVCPEKCYCFERPEDSTFIFDYSQRNLTSVPSDIKKPPNHLRFEFNFSGNRLTRMPDLKAMGCESVKKLILSHNWITEISLAGLSSAIQVLELHNNNVSRIHPHVLEFLEQSTNLTRLTLHENPWECDCNAKEFQSFIRNPTKIVMIPDLINVKCVETNISVLEMKDFCAVNMTMIIGVSTTISLMGFLIGFIGLYYKYQRQIKVWLFAHQWCLWLVTEEELDKEKLYDAFVSYSHKDEDFVVNELVPRLENGSTPFKLCLHYRDWIAGEWIPANIASSVENSRRTIVVLSPNFLESVWGRLEFRAAHSQALSEGRARVILILFGDIGPIDNLDPELKAYISMNTYIKWGDSWFWDRLKYALPHQTRGAQHRRKQNL